MPSVRLMAQLMRRVVQEPGRGWQLLRRPGTFLSVGLVCTLIGIALAGITASAQEKEIKNPLAEEAAAIQEGSSLFRANCALCHGLKARGGGRGPDLTSGLWNHGASDAAIFRTISQGVPGTEMPGSQFEDGEIWALVAYLRSTSAGTHAPVAGDGAKGERIFHDQACAHCHMVKGRGGRLGPELTRVGAARAVAYLRSRYANRTKS
ncbi:MAG: hypothetical protein DMG58_10790 [Acidobacteria bacterium]|nr:MAG: hypothetical protein DMG58_10790 [Acidobacteriota bacterium]